MDYEVKLGKLKTNANGKIEMTRKELRAFLIPYCENTMLVTLLSAIAWLMEDPEFDGSPERFDEVFNNVQRIIGVVYDPNSGFDKNDLARVVREKTNIEVRFTE